MYDINCASARHLEAFADIPQELADKIVAYRKKRKRIFHIDLIDELYRIGGISRKYFRRLVSVFYVPTQDVPRICAQRPCSNALSTVTLQQKHQNTNANSKKRKMKLKNSENQRKIENTLNRGRKGKLQREEISTQSQYKPLGKEYYMYLNSTTLKKLDTVTRNKLAENLGKKVQKKETTILKNRKGKVRCVKRQKKTGSEHRNESSESAPSVQRAHINERVARLLTTVTKSERDNIDMEEDNIRTYRKRSYQSVKRPETTDTDSSESTQSAVVQLANINERVARLLSTVTKSEHDNIEIEEDNNRTYRKRSHQSVKRPETTDTEQSMASSDSVTSAVIQRANFNERVVRMLTTLPKFEDDDIEREEDNIEMYRNRSYRCVKRPETTDTDSSESTQAAVVQRANINERVARLLSTVTKSERDNIDIEEENIDMEEDNIDSKQSTWSSGWSDSISSSEIQRAVDMKRVARLLEDITQLEGDNKGMEEDNIEMEEDNIPTYSKRPYQSVKRAETTDSNMERVARWVAHVHKDEGHNIQMKEGNILISRKRKYRCIKEPEIEDTEQSSDTTESTSSSVIGRDNNDDTKMVARWILTIPKFEGENMEMAEDNISGVEDTPRCAYSCKNCVIL